MALALNKEYEDSSINMLTKLKKLPDGQLKGRIINNVVVNKLLSNLNNLEEIDCATLINDLEGAIYQLEGIFNNL